MALLIVSHRQLWRDIRLELEQDDGTPRIQDKAPPIDERIIVELAGLARVPPNGIEKLRRGLTYEIDFRRTKPSALRTAKATDKASNERTDKQLRRLARLSSDLWTTVRDLEREAVTALGTASMWVELAKQNSQRHENGLPPKPPRLGAASSYDFNRHKQVIEEFAQLSSNAVELARPPMFRYYPKRRGRPLQYGLADPFGANSFSAFVLCLLWDVKAAGGRLTLDKNSESGSFISALELLRPHLPAGFIPRVLPFSTLARLKALDQKTADIFDPLDLF